jgi:hypothetical protein
LPRPENKLEDKMNEKMGALSDEESEALIRFYGSQQ